MRLEEQRRQCFLFHHIAVDSLHSVTHTQTHTHTHTHTHKHTHTHTNTHTHTPYEQLTGKHIKLFIQFVRSIDFSTL